MLELVEVKKGVHLHTFFDGSGTVFFNENTGEKLVLGLTLAQLNKELSKTEFAPELSLLFDSGYLQWTDKGT